jgi:cytochrome o ubiquinol oxidase subunit 3
MSVTTVITRESAIEGHDSGVKMLGFWIYLMTDCILFGALFATYIILRDNTAGGPSGHELFDMPSVLAETLLLLTSSFSCGLAVVASKTGNKRLSLTMLCATFVLGAGFLAFELTEFAHLVQGGNGWQTSAFLSSFFTLVGTHGLHISIGLLWLAMMMWQIKSRGFTVGVMRRLALFGMFWHFLDIIWIFIFTIVYLMGVA